jgi:hypothetical protein
MSNLQLAAEAYRRNQVLAMEANVLSNLLSSFKRKFEPLRNYLGAAGFSINAKPEGTIVLTNEQKRILRHLNGRAFAKVASLEVGTMPHLSSFLRDMEHDVENQISFLKDFRSNILDHYYAYVCQVVSSRDAKASSHDTSFAYDRMRADREANAKKLAHHFQDRTGRGGREVADLVRNEADLEQVYAHSQKMREQFTQVNFTYIKDGVAKCVAALDTLMEDAKSGAIENMSGAVVKSLAAGAYEVAQQAEDASARATFVLGYLGAVNSLTQTLLEAEKQGKF